MGLFDKFKQGLAKTKQLLKTDVRDLFKSQGRLVDDSFDKDVFEWLVKIDMGVDAAQEIADDVAEKFHARVVEMTETVDEIKVMLNTLLAQPSEPIRFAPAGPTVIMVAGVNGCGKTTSIAKLTYMFQAEGKKVVLGAADTFRAAAIDQLRIWSDRSGSQFVAHAPGADPSAVIYDALDAAIARHVDVVIADTAGRLHTKSSLMDELAKMRRVIEKRLPGSSPEILFVLDATTGQNGLSQAKVFHETVGLTGIVLTKLDSTAKGGIVFAIEDSLHVPVRFVGVGEKLGDLLPFDPDAFVSALFA